MDNPFFTQLAPIFYPILLVFECIHAIYILLKSFRPVTLLGAELDVFSGPLVFDDHIDQLSFSSFMHLFR
jgi:hypothetical protein